jgi:hypothetical protein
VVGLSSPSALSRPPNPMRRPLLSARHGMRADHKLRRAWMIWCIAATLARTLINLCWRSCNGIYCARSPFTGGSDPWFTSASAGRKASIASSETVISTGVLNNVVVLRKESTPSIVASRNGLATTPLSTCSRDAQSRGYG